MPWTSLAQNAEPVWSSSDEVISDLADRLGNTGLHDDHLD